VTEAGVNLAQAASGAGQDIARSDHGQDRPARNSARGERSGRSERTRTERTENFEPGTPNERGEPRTDGRNERRPDRNRQQDENTRAEFANDDASRASSGNRAGSIDREAPQQSDSAADANQGNAAAEATARTDGTETREKRSRDRYGRDRGPRGEREQADRQERPVLDVQKALEEVVTEPRKSYFTPSIEAPAMDATAPTVPEIADVTILPKSPVVPTPLPMPAAAPPAATSGMPKLQPFVLPLAELAQVAQSSGLSWVNSDAEKIAAVQAAIAAEPSQIRVARERPVVQRDDSGPLILVETKRDLRDMPLPFETPQ
jgi:ribonuclease E